MTQPAIRETVQVRLERHGRITWPEARTLLAGTTCAWADLDGFHLAPADDLPQDVPQTTHLWAWEAATRCLRLRIDGRHALAAVLHLDDAVGTDLVHIRPGRPWGEDDQQVGPLRPQAHQLGFELLELTGSTPATFVRAIGQRERRHA